MKHLLATIHRQTYGVIYHLFCHYHSNEEYLSPFKLYFNFIKCFGGIILILLFILIMNKPSLDLSFHPDPVACQSVELMKSCYQKVLNSLKYHIMIMSYLQEFDNKKFPLFSKHFLPITKNILDKNIPICPLKSPSLKGPIIVNENVSEIDENIKILKAKLEKQRQTTLKLYEHKATTYFIEEKEEQRRSSKTITKNDEQIDETNMGLPLYMDEIPLGINSPSKCFPHQRTAIIVPYRNRKKHLQLFIRHMHEIMMRQLVEYGIYVINLAGDVVFNRAKLLNIGFTEALLHHEKYDCVIFHDVDLLPENDENIYTCESQPKHMSAFINIFDYKLPYPEIFGGVTAMTPFQFRMVNGYSNSYWGWGGEDDDMYHRLSQKCMTVFRMPPAVARYRMLEHSSDKGNQKTFERYNLLMSARKRLKLDGLSTLRYHVIERDYQSLYNNITVYIGRPEYPLLSKQEMGFHLVLAALVFLVIYFTLLR